MFVTRNLRADNLFVWLSKPVLILFLFNGCVAAVYHIFHVDIVLPGVFITVLGTAVAFFIGFKNNQAYDRMWEARKIWGGIVNDSRTWGMRIVNFVKSEEKQKELIYRHISWMYMHRKALLQPTSWEQIGSKGSVGRKADKFSKKFGLGSVSQDVSLNDMLQYISAEEFAYLNTVANPATQLLARQSAEIKKLKNEGEIDNFEHLQLENLIQVFNTLQGQNERIKKFPFPRDYSTMSRVFISIFIFLLPFSLIPELLKLGTVASWVGVPVAVLLGMLFIIMEDIGDYNETPFMGTPHGMPMLSISRTIEIDLREMLKDEQIPKPIQAKEGILM